jgi:uncharacterized protein YecE (DUF72 family)
MAPEQQLGLFGSEASEPAEAALRPAAVSEELSELADRLPEGLRLGTSSWSFPGWRGIVWEGQGRAPSRQRLARAGLAAYAQHPLFRSVGLDRTYYGPISREAFARYAEDVPAGFRFLVKAHDALVRPETKHFLDAEHAEAQVIDPCVEGLGPEKAGPLVFQFPPLDLRSLGGVAAFTDRLHAFLSCLPVGPLYAVELRNRELADREVYAAVRDAAAVPCFNLHPRMPPLGRQLESQGPELPETVVVRWMLHSGYQYEAARSRYAPFDRLVDPDPDSRDAVAALALDAARCGRDVFVIANNKAEGSAPLTLEALAQRIQQGAAASSAL